MNKLSVCVVAFAALFLVAVPAEADTVTYEFELAIPNGLPVTHLVLYATGSGVDDIYVAPGVLAPTGVHTLSHTLAFNPTSVLILGINDDVAPEKPHVVVFANNAFAASAYGVNWSSVFDASDPAYVRHSEVITHILDAHGGDATNLGNFLRGPQGAAAAFVPGGPFSVIVFSRGSSGGGSIPEPSAMALLVTICTGLGVYRRRRSATVPG